MPEVRALNGPPQVEIIDGRRVLDRDFVVDLGERFTDLELWAAFTRHDSGPDWAISHSYQKTTVVRVRKGFNYDGASIPGWAQSLVMGPKENYEQAGCVHDMLYRLQAPRPVSDSVFYRIARAGAKCVGPVRGWIGWGILRAAGWVAYKENGKKLNEDNKDS